MSKNLNTNVEKNVYEDYDEYIESGCNPKHPEEKLKLENKELTKEDKDSYFGF